MAYKLAGDRRSEQRQVMKSSEKWLRFKVDLFRVILRWTIFQLRYSAVSFESFAEVPSAQNSAAQFPLFNRRS